MTRDTIQSARILIPHYALKALDALESHGFESWCVGGCVRDALLGRSVNDYDIATQAHWTQTERVLSDEGFTIHRTGTKHGTVTASLDGHAIEITTFRMDGSYSDGRHPDQVSFVRNIEEDLARRDFTVNALAYHPQRGILDCWNGIDDLERGVLRVVGEPAERFREDGLRILRGCRFASQLGFSIEGETMQAMTAHKMRLLGVSAERITHELDALLVGDYVHDALVETIDVLSAIMPELAACKGFEQHSPYHIYDVWEHTAWVVQRCPNERLVRWAALFHDIGKPGACFFEGERAHFYGHAQLSEMLARNIMGRLALSPSFAKRVLALVRMHDDQIPAQPRSVKQALEKLDGDVELLEALIALKRADAQAHSEIGQPRVQLADELASTLHDIVASQSAFTVAHLAIDGNDVKAIGVTEGPAIGAALAEALDAVIDERVPNERDDLLEFLKNRCRESD